MDLNGIEPIFPPGGGGVLPLYDRPNKEPLGFEPRSFDLESKMLNHYTMAPTTTTGFEPVRAMPNRLAGGPVNHSGKLPKNFLTGNRTQSATLKGWYVTITPSGKRILQESNLLPLELQSNALPSGPISKNTPTQNRTGNSALSERRDNRFTIGA